MTETCDSVIERRSYFDSNICRLCSLAKDKVLPIFDTSGSKFDAKIKECLSSIKITPSDGKPQQICLECITKLNIYYEFLQLCARSDSHFDSFIRSCKSMEEESEQRNLIGDITEQWTAPCGEQPPSDGLIVLSKLDQRLSEPNQDLVVVVELKYKDGSQSTSHDPLADPTNLVKVEVDVDHEASAVPCEPTELQNSPIPRVEVRFDPIKKEFECGFCNKKFKRRSKLSTHLLRHTGYRPHVCDQCGKSFGMKWDLNVHLRVHKRDIVCSFCDKAFTSKSKLERHFRVHTGEKPFTCSYCDSKFSDKRNLDNHLRIHTGAKPYSCTVCTKEFSVRSHMVEHMNAHKKTASYPCSSCNKSFRWRSNYNKHLKTHSNE